MKTNYWKLAALALAIMQSIMCPIGLGFLIPCRHQGIYVWYVMGVLCLSVIAAWYLYWYEKSRENY